LIIIGDMSDSTLAEPVSTDLQQAHFAKLVARMSGGDESALAELYDATLSRVYAVAQRVCRDAGMAEDVTSEVYYQCWTEAERYDARKARVLTWLLMICRSRAIDAIRAREAAVLHDAPESLVDEDEHARDESPEELLHVTQSGSALHAALGRLAPIQRQMIGLAFFRALSHQEIAAHVSLPLGTVKGHIRRSLELLRRELKRGAQAMPGRS
jgi:RNA polymerase sigma-70 factor, ECF subfamily